MAAAAHLVIAVIVGLLVTAMARREHRRVPLALVIVGVLLNVTATVLPLFAWSQAPLG